MLRQVLECLVFLVIVMPQYTKGSDIIFDKSTADIKPPITKNMTLKCTLKDNVLVANVPIGRRDLTHTADDVMYVTSIVVMHNGVDVASVSEHVPAQKQSNAANLQVTGSISSDPTKRGFLEMDWVYPTESDAGEYQCDVTGINKKGHSFVFSKTLEITKADVTVSDLSGEIAMLKKLVDTVQVEKIGSLTKDLASLRQDVTSLQTDKVAMQGQIKTMTSQISTLTSEKDSLKSRMSVVENRSLAQRSVVRTGCHWTGWINGYDATFQWASPSNAILVGMQSHHDNHHEDRQFSFYYCTLVSPHP